MVTILQGDRIVRILQGNKIIKILHRDRMVRIFLGDKMVRILQGDWIVSYLQGDRRVLLMEKLRLQVICNLFNNTEMEVMVMKPEFFIMEKWSVFIDVKSESSPL